MKKVKITNGVYGYCKPGTKRPDPKHAGDVVDLPDEEAARLVCLKVGVILGDALEGAGGAVATPSEAESTASPGVDRDGGGQGADGVLLPDALDIVDGHFTVESLMTMTRDHMEKLAGDLGVDTSKCRNKGEIAKLLSAVALDPEADGGDAPVLGAEAPVT